MQRARAHIRPLTCRKMSSSSYTIHLVPFFSASAPLTSALPPLTVTRTASVLVIMCVHLGFPARGRCGGVRGVHTCRWMWMMLYLARFLGGCSGTWASTDAHADPVHALWSPPATGCRSVSPYCSSSSICAPQQSPWWWVKYPWRAAGHTLWKSPATDSVYGSGSRSDACPSSFSRTYNRPPFFLAHSDITLVSKTFAATLGPCADH